MKCVVQRVKNASVTVNNVVTGEIKDGILVYVGVTHTDTISDVNWLLNKIPNLRIFKDEEGKLNLSVKDLDYGILVVSQFTLMASCKKGRRPSYDLAAKSEYANKMYSEFVNGLKNTGLEVQTGVFREHMDVKYTNDGPITVIVDSNE